MSKIVKGEEILRLAEKYKPDMAKFEHLRLQKYFFLHHQDVQ